MNSGRLWGLGAVACYDFTVSSLKVQNSESSPGCHAENHFSPTWRFGGPERMNTGCVPVTLTLFRPTLIVQVHNEGVGAWL